MLKMIKGKRKSRIFLLRAKIEHGLILKLRFGFVFFPIIEMKFKWNYFQLANHERKIRNRLKAKSMGKGWTLGLN